MLQLHADKNFHYEALRTLALTRYRGADIGEVLSILSNIKPGDFEDWYREWHNLALRVLSTIDDSKLSSYSPVTLSDVYFRASHYFFVADFFLHGNPSDPRIERAWEMSREYFDKANALLPIPGLRISVGTDHGFKVPAYVFRAAAASDSNPRPTLIVGGGFDSNLEETMHVFGFPALERGYNVVLYEGPGQPNVIHDDKQGFVHQWEKAVNPLVDYLIDHGDNELSFIDNKKMVLLGYSLGGYLSARAAAFEPRLAGVICIDGVWSFEDALFAVFPECKAAWERGDIEAFNREFENTSPSSSTNRRWFHDHAKFSFQLGSAWEVFQELSKMTLDGVADKIKMPAFIGEAEEDIFFLGQPARVAQAIGEKATLVPFTTEQAAGAHCQSGALTYLNQQIMEWFAEVTGVKSA